VLSLARLTALAVRIGPSGHTGEAAIPSRTKELTLAAVAAQPSATVLPAVGAAPTPRGTVLMRRTVSVSATAHIVDIAFSTLSPADEVIQGSQQEHSAGVDQDAAHHQSNHQLFEIEL